MQVRMGIVLRREWLRVRPAPAPPRWALIRSHRTGQSGRGGTKKQQHLVSTIMVTLTGCWVAAEGVVR